MVKVIMMFKRKPGLSLEEFSRYWYDVHGPLVARLLPGLKKYVQNHPIILSTGRPKFDGAAELWFDDQKSWKRAGDFYSGPEGKVIRDDEAEFLDSSSSLFFISEEKVIK